MDYIIFWKFSTGISVASLLQKEDRITCLPQIPGKFVVFAPEPAIAVQHDNDSLGIRVFRVIVVEFDPVPCSDFTVLYMLLPPEPVLSLHYGNIILFSKEMNLVFDHDSASYNSLAFAG